MYCGQVPSVSALLPEPLGRDEVTAAEDEEFFALRTRCMGYVTVEFRLPPPPDAAAKKAAAAGVLDGGYRRGKVVAESFSLSSGSAGGTQREILVPLTRNPPSPSLVRLRHPLWRGRDGSFMCVRQCVRSPMVLYVSMQLRARFNFRRRMRWVWAARPR